MFKRRRSTDDFAEEIKAHLELEADDSSVRALAMIEARRKARVEFGNVPAAQEHFYLRNRVLWLDNLVRDIKFAIRQLARNPGFSATTILVLALGIGASVAIFGFVDAALLQPLPYPDPGRLMSVNESNTESPRWPLSYPDYLEWQRLNKSFSSLDVYSGRGYLLRTPSGAEPVQGGRVSGGFFQTLGVRPMLGRDFTRAKSGRPECSGPELRSVAASVRHTARRRGPNSRPRQRDLHDHWRFTPYVFVRTSGQRGVLGTAQYLEPSRTDEDFL